LGSFTIETLPMSFFKDGSFKYVFLLETIEHLLPEQLSVTLKEIHRLLAPGGFVVITTQNEENLRRHETICPDCGAVFHRMQHMGSFNADSISEIMSGYKFKTFFCKSLNFRRKSIESSIKGYYEAIRGYMGGSIPKKNLIYMGMKD
jgi:ubiquinone/menaquinone biosynthesis C-methylase UbiE